MKQGSGKEIVMFGSPTLASGLLKKGLIDEVWIFLNPVILGSGISLYQDIDKDINLDLIDSRIVSGGVVCSHYKCV